MSQKFDTARTFLHLSMKNKEVTEKEIDEKIAWILDSDDFKDIDREELKQTFLNDVNYSKEDSTLLTNREVKPWVKSKKSKINWNYWDRYELYLKSTKPEIKINDLDNETDWILDQMMNPKTPGSWLTKGLVVGHVQSGKTANYIGLLNKASDAGYRFIVVIAGIHNTLRSQTQARIDAGFIGKSSRNQIERKSGGIIGVGKYPEINGEKVKEPLSFTSTDIEGDFSYQVASQLNIPINNNHPIVLVIKKQKNVLENLISWLNNFTTQKGEDKRSIDNLPLLLIDDEADHASVDTKKEIDEARTINRHIRTLLSIFEKRTYIGYTATPFANLFIPEEWSKEHENIINGIKYKVGPDLFPDNFILNIKAPPNYIGAKRVFGFHDVRTGKDYDGLSLIKLVKDTKGVLPNNLNKKNLDYLPDKPDDIPPSLEKAVKFFVVSSAIRRLRGQDKKHHSMLVHISRFKIWINRFAYIINEIIKDVENELRAKDRDLINELKELWLYLIQPVTEEIKNDEVLSGEPSIKEHDWESIKEELYNAVSKIEVKAIHGKIDQEQQEELGYKIYDKIGTIDYDSYEEGASVIAVGGDKMSRGLTLEGLSVSYFLRTSKLYDSLMQMGRWFGFRPGYVDLCKLYTTSELYRWYRHITLATEIMRDDFDDMALKNKTPKDYQLKVMTHPEQLGITGAGKLREFEKINLSFSGIELQTYQLSKHQEIIKENFQATENLIKKLGRPNNEDEDFSKYIWENVSSEYIVHYLESYKTDQPNLKPDLIKNYIKKQEQKGRLKKWTIILMNSKNKQIKFKKLEKNKIKEVKAESATYNFTIGDKKRPVRMLVRNDISVNRDSEEYFLLQRNAIMGSGDRFLDLDENRLNKRTKGGNRTKKIAVDQRTEEEKGLLIIYPLDPRSTDNVPKDIPLIGFALLFPRLDNKEEQKAEFAVRKSYNPDIGWVSEYDI